MPDGFCLDGSEADGLGHGDVADGEVKCERVSYLSLDHRMLAVQWRLEVSVDLLLTFSRRVGTLNGSLTIDSLLSLHPRLHATRMITIVLLSFLS